MIIISIHNSDFNVHPTELYKDGFVFNEMGIQKAMSERAVIYWILCRQKLQGGTNMKD